MAESLKPQARLQLLHEIYDIASPIIPVVAMDVARLTEGILRDEAIHLGNDDPLVARLRSLPADHLVWSYVWLDGVGGVVARDTEFTDVASVPAEATREQVIRSMYAMLEALNKVDAVIIAVEERSIRFSMTLEQAFTVFPWSWGSDPRRHLAERVAETFPNSRWIEDELIMLQLVRRVEELWLEVDNEKPTQPRRARQKRKTANTEEARETV